jgi:hypothetical protein
MFEILLAVALSVLIALYFRANDILKKLESIEHIAHNQREDLNGKIALLADDLSTMTDQLRAISRATEACADALPKESRFEDF